MEDGHRREEDRRLPPALSFKARIFVALVGISSVTSLIIGLVLYYFAQDRLVHAENTLLKQRSQTANAGAQDFLEGLRDPEDKTLPPAPDLRRGARPGGRRPDGPRGALRRTRHANPWPPATASGIPSTPGKHTESGSTKR